MTPLESDAAEKKQIRDAAILQFVAEKTVQTVTLKEIVAHLGAQQAIEETLHLGGHPTVRSIDDFRM